MTQVDTNSRHLSTPTATPLPDPPSTPVPPADAISETPDESAVAARPSRLPWRRGSSRPRSGGMFSALSNRNFRIYAGGAAVSNIGTWMQRVAQDWLVLELSHGSGVAVGITTALQFLPMLLLSPYGGLIADREIGRAHV